MTNINITSRSAVTGASILAAICFFIIATNSTGSNNSRRNLLNGPSAIELQSSAAADDGANKSGLRRLLLTDPKTIQTKEDITLDQLGSSKLTHPELAALFYKLRDDQIARNGGKLLTVLSFGTGMTWGSGLDSIYDSDDKRLRKLYPDLLGSTGPNTRNLALPNQGPHYPAMCTQSMIGNEDKNAYDVITIEYYIGNKPTLTVLYQRLRHRYPHAIIILLRVWRLGEVWFHRNPTTGEVLSLPDWMEQHKTQSHHHAVSPNLDHLKTDFHTQLSLETKPEEWFFNDASQTSKDTIEQQDQIIRDMNDKQSPDSPGGVYLIDVMPERENFFAAMTLYDTMFLSNMKTWTEFGHLYVATKIQKLLHDIQYEPESKFHRLHPEEVLQPWLKKDHCSMWLTDGKVDELLVPKYEGMGLNAFEHRSDRYALQIPKMYARKTQIYSHMEVHNPFNKPMYCFISFIASGHREKYQNTNAWVVQNLNNAGHPPGGQPVAKLNPYLESHHEMDQEIVVTKNVGVLQKGVNFVMFRHVDWDGEKELGFRIVGVVIRDGEEIQHMQLHEDQAAVAEMGTEV